MAKLVYSAITSLDGYVADRDGNFRCLAPDEEVHRFVNDHERVMGTYLYGRRMYEVMAVWETTETTGAHQVIADYAGFWRAAEKVVYSTTLEVPASAKTRIERSFDPDEIRAMKAAADRDISIGGPHLAAEALRAGLVDDIHLFISPVIIGGGNSALPDDLRLDVELVDQHRFGNGVVHCHYNISGPPSP
jgi:dihydrofolate reductase